jgi:hypothetical protein
MSTVRRPSLPQRWTTSSAEFNQRVEVAAQTERDAARLLTPSLVQRVLDLCQDFEQLDIHMPGDSVCISFDDDDLLQRADWKYRSDRIDDIEERVQTPAALHKLDAILEFLAAVGAAVPGNATDPVRSDPSSPAPAVAPGGVPTRDEQPSESAEPWV